MMLSVQLIVLAAITVNGDGQGAASQTANQKKQLEVVASFLSAQMRLEYAVGSLEEASTAFSAAAKAYDEATKTFLAVEFPAQGWVADDKKTFLESAFQSAATLTQLLDQRNVLALAQEDWAKHEWSSAAGQQARSLAFQALTNVAKTRDEFYSRCWRVLVSWREQESGIREAVESLLPAPTYYYVRERLNTFVDFREEDASRGSTLLPDPAWPTRCVLHASLMPQGGWSLVNAKLHDVFVQDPDRATTALFDQFAEAAYIAKRGDTVFAMRKPGQEWVDVDNWRQLVDTARKLSEGVYKPRLEVMVGRTRNSAKTVPVWFVLKPLRPPFSNPWAT